MAQWERIRHRVALAGRVTDVQTNKTIAGVEIRIVKAPDAFIDRLKNLTLQHKDLSKKIVKSPERTQTARDGHFHFLDLPEGEYGLTASLPSAGKRYGTASVEVKVSKGNNVIAIADMKLPPTCLKGKIVDGDADPVVLAKVGLKYTEESSFSDREGRYLLNEIEASENFERTLIVSAQGYQTTSETVILSKPGIEETFNFVLTKQSKNL